MEISETEKQRKIGKGKIKFLRLKKIDKSFYRLMKTKREKIQIFNNRDKSGHPIIIKRIMGNNVRNSTSIN